MNHGKYATTYNPVTASAIINILSTKLGGSMSSIDGVDSGRAINN